MSHQDRSGPLIRLGEWIPKGLVPRSIGHPEGSGIHVH